MMYKEIKFESFVLRFRFINRYTYFFLISFDLILLVSLAGVKGFRGERLGSSTLLFAVITAGGCTLKYNTNN